MTRQATPSPANPPYVATMTFDAPSVRENKNLEVNAGVAMSAHFVPNTTVLRVRNLDIENLIGDAYGLDRYQVVGVPHWPWPALFVIDARSDSEADAKMAALTEEQQQAEQQHMLQVLLKERFKLKTHWETKEGDVYRLMVAKGVLRPLHAFRR